MNITAVSESIILCCILRTNVLNKSSLRIVVEPITFSLSDFSTLVNIFYTEKYQHAKINARRQEEAGQRASHHEYAWHCASVPGFDDHARGPVGGCENRLLITGS